MIEVDGHVSHFLMAPARMEARLRKLGIAAPEKGPGDHRVLFYPSGSTLGRSYMLRRYGYPLLALPARRLWCSNTEAAAFLQQHGVKLAGTKRKAGT